MPALCYAPSLLTLLIKVVSRVLQLQSIYVGINIRSNNVQTLYNGNDALGRYMAKLEVGFTKREQFYIVTRLIVFRI